MGNHFERKPELSRRRLMKLYTTAHKLTAPLREMIR
jgi:hypothetical protein